MHKQFNNYSTRLRIHGTFLGGNAMKKTTIFLLLCLTHLAWSAEPNEIQRLRAENAQLKQQCDQLQQINKELENQIQQLTGGNKLSKDEDVNCPKRDTTLLLKQKISLMKQKQAKLAQLKTELLSISPTIKQSQPDLVTKTVTKTSITGRYTNNRYESSQDVKRQKVLDKDVPNPDYKEQKVKIRFLENSIALLEKEIQQMNNKRIKDGQEPIE
jgi:hypothetical protein